MRFFLKIIIPLWVFSCLLSACATAPSTNKDNVTKLEKTAEINTQLGMAYLEKQDMQRAKQKFLLALTQAPKSPQVWYSMAYFLEVTGDKQQAKEYYSKAVNLAPNRGDVQNNFGTFLCRSGEYDAAIQHFLLAVKDPEYIETSSAYENAGLCALKIPNKRLALQYFNQAAIQDPNSAVALIEAARLNYDFGNYASAKIKLQQFLAISPPTPQSIYLSRQLEQKL